MFTPSTSHATHRRALRRWATPMAFMQQSWPVGRSDGPMATGAMADHVAANAESPCFEVPTAWELHRSEAFHGQCHVCNTGTPQQGIMQRAN